MDNQSSVDDLVRDSKVTVIERPPLFVRFAGSSYPHGRISDASYSTLERNVNAAIATKRFATSTLDAILGRGFNLVLGMSSSGKTTYLNELSKITGWEVKKFFEPDPDSNTSLDEFCEMLHKFINDQDGPEGLLIDSFKAIVYSKGNLSKGGINMSSLQEMSNLSAIAAKSGKIIVGSLNLTSDDLELYNAYSEAAVGSINGLINLTSRGVARYRVRDYNTGERYDTTSKWVKTGDRSRAFSDVDDAVVEIQAGANTDWDATLSRASRGLYGHALD